MVNHQLMLNAIGNNENSQEVRALLADLPPEYERSDAPDMDEFYLNFKSEGVSLLFDIDRRLVATFLYAVAKEGFSEYRGWLGDGVSAECGQSDVARLVGSSVATGKAGKGMFNLYNPAWSKHKYDGVLLHYQYGEHTQAIDMLTIMCER